MGAGGKHQGFSVAVESYHGLRAGRHDGEAVAAQRGQAGQEEAERPDRPPVEKHGMSNDADLTWRFSAGCVWLLSRGHGSSFPVRVVVVRPAVLRQISRNHRKDAVPNSRPRPGREPLGNQAGPAVSPAAAWIGRSPANAVKGPAAKSSRATAPGAQPPAVISAPS